MITDRERPAALGVPRRRRRRTLRWVLGGLAAIFVFALGVAVGDALDDNPQPGGTLTYVRTLEPLPVEPAPEER